MGRPRIRLAARQGSYSRRVGHRYNTGRPPPMVEFKAKLDDYIKKEFGIEVEHLYKKDKNGEKVTYEKVFYKPRK